MWVIAFIEHEDVIKKILKHSGICYQNSSIRLPQFDCCLRFAPAEENKGQVLRRIENTADLANSLER